MSSGGDNVRVAYPLFYQVESGGSIPTSPLQLQIVKSHIKVAKKLNKEWHSRLPRFDSCAVLCYAALYDGKYYATAIWSNPIARLLPQDTWLELRRLAIAPDAPKNTASRMISIMTKLIKTELPHITTLISYQDTEVHTGTIYKASGWAPVAYNKDGEWNRPNRYRPKAQSGAPK